MTAFELQKDLAEEVEDILKEMLLKDVKGQETRLRAFQQCLPKRKQTVDGDVCELEEEEDPYPYCVVRIDSGKLETAQSAGQVQTVLVFGIFDDDRECQGHQAILNMIHRITERFTEDPVIKDRYRMNAEAGISWVLDEEDQYPYYFGAMEMTWDTFFVRRKEDRYV